MNITFLGPPGSGKGTQAIILSKQLGIPHISTGDILRNEVEKNTDFGKKVSEIMKRGELISDDIIAEIISKKLQKDECAKGFILDGVPRSLGQAHALKDNGIQFNHILELYCEDEDIVNRLSNRRVHPASGRTYNLISNPPKTAGKDDITGEDLVQREDDLAETIYERLKNYKTITAPLCKYYQELAQKNDVVHYHRINGSLSPDDITVIIKGLITT